MGRPGRNAGRKTDSKAWNEGRQSDKDRCFSSVLLTLARKSIWALPGWDQHCQHLYYLVVFGGVHIETIQKYPERLL